MRAHNKRFLLEVWNYATIATKMCVRTSNANELMLYKMWYNKPPLLEQLQ